ncbi:MAG TPA: hypothetical protein VGG39_30455 [Polyangiaceae bacterium]|jgi:hypothetical protein
MSARGIRPIHVTVTSTAAAVSPETVGRCVRSVLAQTYPHRRHVYVLADATDDLAGLDLSAHPAVELRKGVYPKAPELANLWPLWQSLPDEEVIAWVDGDDYLATPYVLEIVARAHAAGALATYGQFMWMDGSVGFAAPVGDEPRREPWRATHLKTFRAGLVKRIREQDLKTPDGKWTFVTDQPVMLPILELAGPRARFIPNILYVYAVPNLQADLARHDPEYMRRQHAEIHRVRALPPYQRLGAEECDQIAAASP